MKRLLFALILISLGSTCLGQETWPPDGARILGLDPVVPLRWEGSPRDRYLLQVYASEKEVVSKEVQGNSARVQLWPGSYYRWQVARLEKGGSYTLISPRSFTLSKEVEFKFSGKNGQDGKSGSSSRDYGRSGESGTPGSNGESGGDVTVVFEPFSNDVLNLSVNGPYNNQSYFLLAGTPIYITTRGGNGGAGGDGGHGAQGLFFVQANRGFVQSASFPPGIGGDGGPGGEGGRGGNVTVRALGVPNPPTVHVDNQGGQGGRGGAPGAGGAAAIIPNFYRGGIPAAFQGPAPPGRPGPNGRQGLQGQAFHR